MKRTARAATLAAALRREALRTARMLAPVLGPQKVATLAQYRKTVELLMALRAPRGKRRRT